MGSEKQKQKKASVLACLLVLLAFGSFTFTVSWSENDSGKYVLDIYVQRDYVPTNATVNINGENKTTNLIGKTTWQLTYGTYQITAYQETEKQSVTLLLNGDTTKTFNFTTPIKRDSNSFLWLTLVLAALFATFAYFMVFAKRRK